MNVKEERRKEGSSDVKTESFPFKHSSFSIHGGKKERNRDQHISKKLSLASIPRFANEEQQQSQPSLLSSPRRGKKRREGILSSLKNPSELCLVRLRASSCATSHLRELRKANSSSSSALTGRRKRGREKNKEKRRTRTPRKKRRKAQRKRRRRRRIWTSLLSPCQRLTSLPERRKLDLSVAIE